MSAFTFTEDEKSLILLGASSIVRTVNGVSTNYIINTFGDTAYKFNVIKERLSNNGELNLATLYTNLLSTIQSSYPSLYNIYTSTSNPQTITANTIYTTN